MKRFRIVLLSLLLCAVLPLTACKYRIRLEKRRELLLAIRSRLPEDSKLRRLEIERELKSVENVLQGEIE